MLNKGEYEQTTKTFKLHLQLHPNCAQLEFCFSLSSLEIGPHATSYFIFKVLLTSTEIGGTEVHEIQSFHAQLATVIL